MKADEVRKILRREKLHELYVDKRLNPNDIARQYGCSDFLIRTLFREFGVTPRTREEAKSIARQSGKFHKRQGIKQILTPNKLRDLYFDEKLSLEDIARKYGCTCPYIRKLFCQYRLVPRNRSQVRREVLKAGKLTQGYYTMNENFFKKWSPEMAYVLGIYATDGALFDHGYTKSISLSSADKTFLEKIRSLMNSNYPIRRQRNNKTSFIYHMVFSHQKIFEDLLKLGITPKKSFTLKFPPVPSQYLRHFIRGVFDGDGCISIEKQRFYKFPRPRVTFTSASKNFIFKLNELLHTEGGLSIRKIYHYHNAYRLIYFGAEYSMLLKYLYKNSPNLTYLKRKYNKFVEWNEKYGKIYHNTTKKRK